VGPDPLLGAQWHLQNTGQNGGVPGEDLRALPWPGGSGAGVRVAVIDDAVEVVHADLFPNLVPGASLSYRSGNRGSQWPLPCTAAVDDHGTAVAGIILARDGNASGGAGVAPRASLVAYDALSSSTDGDIADALTRDLARNAVYNNSWGSPDNGKLHRADAAFVRSVEFGIAEGRGGLGAVYVFPGGNGGCYLRNGDLPGEPCVDDNANFDGFVNQRGVHAVCAVDDGGRRPWYGEPGANLLVCAPSSGDKPVGITTAGLRDTYRDDFSGTSASTPMVSGVVAAMLAANPQLTWRDVRLILAATARRNDAGDPGWQPAADGLSFNHKYGFGVADATRAVAAAAGWTSVGGTRSLKTCSVERAPALPIPDAPADGVTPPTVVTDAVTVAGCDIGRIEFVEVVFTATHTYSGDLQVRLSSPAGHVSELAEARLCVPGGAVRDACGPFTDWPFGSVRHLGEAANGTWTLSVSDRTPQDAGVLQRWSLRVHGR
jgi:subtilisin-like proprotein convertase family protein